MTVAAPEAVLLKNYRKPDYLIHNVDLTFDLHEEHTHVFSRLDMVCCHQAETERRPLILNGEKLKLISLKVNGVVLEPSGYRVTAEALEITGLPDEFYLEIETEIEPQENKALEGLYKSGDIFCTQNESEGFRHITYYLDRPDVMAKFKTRIQADKLSYPILLSNGNPIDQGDLPEGRHFVTWQDPFMKPCYLFALVAGNLGMIEDCFRTGGGRNIDLRIYVDKGNEDRAAHAMDCLKKAMKWDEDVFGREYDLDIYMIVAVDSFNFGAMENKGLNIFNSQCLLASPKTATDRDFENILGVVGHEYFHNWTGNRITCRDWFQITLKEGLTIFRDQEFSADMTSRPVQRIADVGMIKDYQFVEDGGPNSHPIRPDSYIEINNFYTSTVYNKGSEVIRMIQTLIGKQAFRKGMDTYFELFDGQAVTTENFVQAMEEASGHDLTQFKNWYSQSGTPRLNVTMDYEADQQKVTLHMEQTCPATADQQEKQPFYFPVKLGLIGEDGKDLELRPSSGSDGFLRQEEWKEDEVSIVLALSEPKQTFEFEGIKARPVPSLLRGFSAPVKLEYDYSPEELSFLLAHDVDEVTRYDAGQRLAKHALRQKMAADKAGQSYVVPREVLDAYGRLLGDDGLDPAFRSLAFSVPSLANLIEDMAMCDYEGAHAAREFLLKELAATHETRLRELYARLHVKHDYQVDSESVGRRSLQNTCLSFLALLGKPDDLRILAEQYRQADNMTDKIVALALLCDTDSAERQSALDDFYQKWQSDFLVMNKWFVVQAYSRRPSVLDDVKALEKNPAFDITNPNKVRSLIGAYSHNLVHFHDKSGEGYAFLTDKIIEIDKFNSGLAARLATSFEKYSRMDADRQELMRTALQRVLDTKPLSRGVYEIVSKTLGK